MPELSIFQFRVPSGAYVNTRFGRFNLSETHNCSLTQSRQNLGIQQDPTAWRRKARGYKRCMTIP